MHHLYIFSKITELLYQLLKPYKHCCVFGLYTLTYSIQPEEERQHTKQRPKSLHSKRLHGLA